MDEMSVVHSFFVRWIKCILCYLKYDFLIGKHTKKTRFNNLYITGRLFRAGRLKQTRMAMPPRVQLSQDCSISVATKKNKQLWRILNILSRIRIKTFHVSRIRIWIHILVIENFKVFLYIKLPQTLRVQVLSAACCSWPPYC